jgi:hypothetical protein
MHPPFIHLQDGMATARDYRMDTGKLEPGFVTPEAFRKAVEEALKGFLKEQGA